MQCRLSGSQMPVAAPLSAARVVRVATFGTHALAVCADGGVFSWGVADHGRLGHGDKSTNGAHAPDRMYCLYELTVHT